MNKITKSDIEAFKFVGQNTLEHYQTIATRSAFYPGQNTVLGLTYCALKLNGEAGELAEHVGKAMRDDDLMSVNIYESDVEGVDTVVDLNLLPGTGLTPERRKLIIKEVGDILWYLSAICNELGITLQEAAIENLEKLCDRTERGKLSGSGDER